jgi:hypothetical protein
MQSFANTKNPRSADVCLLSGTVSRLFCRLAYYDDNSSYSSACRARVIKLFQSPPLCVSVYLCSKSHMECYLISFRQQMKKRSGCSRIIALLSSRCLPPCRRRRSHSLAQSHLQRLDDNFYSSSAFHSIIRAYIVRSSSSILIHLSIIIH